MNINEDLDKFTELWKASCELAGKGPSDSAITLAFGLLSKYEWAPVRSAILSHMTKSEFSPKPVNIISFIESQDGRPTADEAWAIAIESFDEYRSVNINQEIMQSLSEARGIYHDGDKVGARLAFRAAYDRTVSKARASGDGVGWYTSQGIGNDKGERRDVMEKGELEGLFGPGQQKLLGQPAIIDFEALEHEANKDPGEGGMSVDEKLEVIAKVKKMLGH
jgi:hypothetical protein